MSRIIWDASILTMYPLGKPGFRGGTENMIGELAPRLAAKGHTVHVVTRDLEIEEQRGPNIWYWPKSYHPTDADVVIETQHISPNINYNSPILILAHTGCDPFLGENGEWAQGVDAWPVFSEEHKKMLLRERPQIPGDRVHVVGLGVNTEDYCQGDPMGQLECDDCAKRDCANREYPKVQGRMLYANDPMRGLFYVLDIFDLVKKEVPEATLHVAYDADRQFAVHQWEHTYKAQLSLEMKYRLENTPGVVNLGALSKEELIREQLECQVHCMPSDPPNVGTQTHGILQMECAAAGAALVLSDVEAFPEVFVSAATILPVIGYFDGKTLKRRVNADDYAQTVIEIMQKPELFTEMSRKSRALAEKNTWDICADRWGQMINKLTEKNVE